MTRPEQPDVAAWWADFQRAGGSHGRSDRRAAAPEAGHAVTRPAARIRTRTPVRAIGYVRVSTEKQADSGLSLEARRGEVENWGELFSTTGDKR